MNLFDLGLTLAAVAAGGVASVTGFGIGSILTPLLSLEIGTKLAVGLVSIPHLIATFLRFWMMKEHVDRRVLLSFGVMSAAGGLLGAFLHTKFATPALTLVFGIILIFAGGMGSSGLSEKLRFGKRAAWLAGALSGALGGLVGNQGGIRSAAMLSFDIRKEAFVATATAIGLIVDGARMPIYFVAEAHGILSHGRFILLAVAGVVTGTFLGTRFLHHIPEKTFRRTVSFLILLLGVFMFYKGVSPA